ncbi:putative ribosome biogenesis GTPase RsgA [Bacteroidia bacterium]|nr:putative ribosome biogenesis GTPase RsgA [Bacteroidia bacterium]GHV71364.1 putative ribosome biogenesis GTPase RsgA [Bacteroidia bacterium]
MKGLVVKNTGSLFQIKTEDNRLIDAKLKGNFRLKDIKSTNPVSVGDFVLLEENPEGAAFICEIEDRRNYIVRRSSNLSKQSHVIAANVDQAFLIVTINYPITTPTFIDRFLATTEAYRIPTILFFNKIDRYNYEDREYADALAHLYETIGYTCYKISAKETEDLSFMQELLQDKTTLISGHSGVGKSTLINRFVPGSRQKTREISDYHNKGMHTTTFSEMIEIPGGGYIIDTPGIKGFGVFDMEGIEISHYFPEIFQFSHNCKFNNCTHRREPGCAVLKAVEDHYVSESRYKSYLNILEDKNDGKYRDAY